MAMHFPINGAAMVQQGLPLGNSPERAARVLVFVDLVESVRLMASDEHDAVLRWRRLVGRVQNDILPVHGGRLVKSMGDGLMLEFSDAQRTMRAAFAIQHACVSANTGVPPDRHLLLRMGAHLGQLITGEHDVYGHAVNLAARLTTLAGPGEIVVSADVRDHLAPVLDADIEDLGLCYLKHLHEPVRAYRVGPPGPRPVIEAGAASLPDLRPTIAVIPFSERGGEAEHRVLGEVLADETIASLSRTVELNVISRLSTTIFRGRETSIGELSGLLNADYVLSGAYRVVGTRIRLTAELVAAKSGGLAWSDSLEGQVAGIISGKGALVEKLVAAASTAIMATELQRAQSQPLPNLESYSLLMGAIALMHRLSFHDFDRAYALLQALTDRVPRLAVPWAWKAKWHVLRVQQGWSEDTKAEGQLAFDCARRALDADPDCSLALAVAGLVHTHLSKKHDAAFEHYDRALRINPNDSLAWLLKGTLHAFMSEGRIAVEGTRRALKLSPLDPHRYYYDSLAATAYLSAHQFDHALKAAQRSYRANRTHTSTLRAMAIAQWQLGLHEDARRTARELLTLEPSLTIDRWRERAPSADYSIGKEWAGVLRQVGVPQ